MSTIASEMWRSYMATSCSLPDYPSAVFSGIVSDLAHRLRNTYHSGIEDLPNPTGYTNFHPDDKAPPGDWPRNLASAGDKSMSTPDMIKEWNRYQVVYDNQNDPRRKYLAEYIGWNGRGDAERLDFQKNTRTVSTSDHKWHSHRAGRRRYAEDSEFARAALSIEKGESIEQYLSGSEVEMELRAEYGMGMNDRPISDNTKYLQELMNELIIDDDPRLIDHPLTVDGKYWNNTAYWVSVLLTGGEGKLVDGEWFAKLVKGVSTKLASDEITKHLSNMQHGGGQLPDSLTFTIPAQTITAPIS